MGDFIHPEAKMTRDSFIYKLVATINHYGYYNYGHYNAVCKRQVELDGQKFSRWFEFDDCFVTEIENGSPLNNNTVAFILELEENEKYDRDERFRELKPWLKSQFSSEPIEAIPNALRSYQNRKSIEQKFHESGR